VNIPSFSACSSNRLLKNPIFTGLVSQTYFSKLLDSRIRENDKKVSFSATC
jgi:hypothetical protein